MRICISQTKPFKGDIEQNLESHIAFIKSAIVKNVDLIVFPELSLTGYELELAKELATTEEDSRFDILQKLSNENSITIAVGLPTILNNDVFISMLIFQPNKQRVTYSKQYLYQTEKDFFKAGHHPIFLNFNNEEVIAPTICYEISNKEHSENASNNNATIYLASVFNSVEGVDSDIEKLSVIAAKYKMTVFMVNYVGQSGGYESGGKSSIWNSEGKLIAQLDHITKGMLIFDTKTKEIIMEKMNID